MITNENTVKILLVDDDEVISKSISERFAAEGWQTTIVRDGSEVCNVFTQSKFDIVIMDIMLPNVDGFTLIRQLRRISNVPILVLTAILDINDEVNAYELGADDYMRKPLRPSVLIAHVARWLERAEMYAKISSSAAVSSSGSLSHEENKTIQIRDLYLDTSEKSIYKISDHKRTFLNLTHQEYQLLKYFMLKPDVSVSREQIQKNAWDWKKSVDSRVVDAFIKLLRKKLGPGYIKTVHKFGYRFVSEPED